MSEANSCGCGRSPTGKCIGWHNMTEEQYAEKKAQYEVKQALKRASYLKSPYQTTLMWAF